MPRKKIYDAASIMGPNSKVVIVEDKHGNVKKIKQKGKHGKLKEKFDKSGYKKAVFKKGLLRLVHKPKRDNRKSMANTIRNLGKGGVLDYKQGGIIQHD
jgi:hypothetical protein